MIIDKFCNVQYYKELLPYLDNALEKVKEMKALEAPEALEVGRYEFEGGFLLVLKGTTNPIEEGEFELHRDYLDLHVILRGSEELAWGYIDDLTVTVPFDAEKDSEWRKGSIAHSMMLDEGMMFVVFANDGHMPYRHTSKAQDYIKICIKLPLKK